MRSFSHTSPACISLGISTCEKNDIILNREKKFFFYFFGGFMFFGGGFKRGDPVGVAPLTNNPATPLRTQQSPPRSRPGLWQAGNSRNSRK